MNPRRCSPVFSTALALVVLAGTAGAAPLATRRACRSACATLVERCHELGVRRVACRRQLVRRCVRVGLDACTVDDGASTTTTTFPFESTTTTTLDPGPTVHGCNRNEAEDHRGESLVVVQFIPFDYAPECIVVSSGTTVRFEGDFRTFPLVGGEVPDEDPTSPFNPPVRTGLSHDFVLTTSGIHPYFTEVAWTVLFHMWGAVIVE